MTNNFRSCADCTEFLDPKQCKKYNNFFSKIIGFFLRSDRSACISQIKQHGLQKHADIMAEKKIRTIKL